MLNLEVLFQTKHFYKIVAESTGRTVYYGTWETPEFIYTGATLEEAALYTETHRDENGNHAPILLYPSFSNHLKDYPMFAIMENGEVLEFAKGYYAEKSYDTIANEILKEYMNQKPQEQPGTAMCTNPIFFSVNYADNIRRHLRTKGYYAVYNEMIEKYEEGRPYEGQTHSNVYTENMKDGFAWILQDKKQDENSYPIIVFSSGDPNKAKPVYIVFDSGEIKHFTEGYYDRPLFPRGIDVNDFYFAIELIYDEEMTALLKKIPS